MVKIVITSDTHVPTRARALPDPLLRAIDSADVVFHAGDWVDVATLDLLERRAARLIGVYGNNDGPDLRARLPEIARVELAGLRFAMIHETGSRTAREDRADAAFPDADVLIFGHSHIPWDSRSARGLRLLNPGSPTDRRRQPARTFMTLEVADGDIRALSIQALSIQELA